MPSSGKQRVKAMQPSHTLCILQPTLQGHTKQNPCAAAAAAAADVKSFRQLCHHHQRLWLTTHSPVFLQRPPDTPMVPTHHLQQPQESISCCQVLGRQSHQQTHHPQHHIRTYIQEQFGSGLTRTPAEGWSVLEQMQEPATQADRQAPS
jgi:hypothetical protein